MLKGKKESENLPMTPFEPLEKWEFNTLGIYDYKRPGHLDLWFNYIRLTESLIDGDVVEAGVYRGHTLLATALLLRELGSQKRVFGFDSFSGFPKPNLEHQSKIITSTSKLDMSSHQQSQVVRLKQIKEGLESESFLVARNAVSSREISSSGSFSDPQKDKLEQKIKFLGLTNIVLIDGFFNETMVTHNLPNQIYASFLDCDLHESYTTALQAIWPLLSRGSFVYMDEYYSLKFLEARVAVDAFLINKPFKKVSYSGLAFDDFERNGFIKL